MRTPWKRRLYLISGIILLSGITAVSLTHLLPANILYIHEKPEQKAENNYRYYRIIAVEDARTLMYVPVKVTLGDELITEDNKRYKVVRIEENRAYARFIENVPLKKYSPQR